MKNALVLDGHSRAAIETTQALGRVGVTVFASCEASDAIAFQSRYATHKLSQPSVVLPDKFLEWLQELDARHQFQLIVPSTEISLQALLHLPEGHSLFRRAVLPSTASLQIALDKNRTYELALDLHIPVPATRQITRLADIGKAGSFPLVIKPLRSKLAEQGEMKSFEPAIVLDDAARCSVLEDWLPRMQVLEQEYVSGWGVGIELLYRSGALVWYFAHERLHEWPLTGGASTYRRAIEPPPEMLEAATRLLDALRWNGVAMVEFKRRQDGSFVLMEINPRLWGSVALSVDAGVNFPLGLWQVAAGLPLSPQPKYRCGIRTRHLGSDLQWLKANCFADRANPLLLTRPRWRSFAEFALPIMGREHWDHFHWTDLRPTFYELGRMLNRSIRWVRRRLRKRSLMRHRGRIIQAAMARASRSQIGRPQSLLFICQANICRSAFAAVVARDRIRACCIDSAGFDRRAGRRTPRNVAQEAAHLGIDMSRCSSTPVTEDHLRRADLILLMDLTHLDQLASRFPQYLNRAVLLGLFADKPLAEIEDPNHKDTTMTRRVLLEIVASINGLAEAITPLGLVSDSCLVPQTMQD